MIRRGRDPIALIVAGVAASVVGALFYNVLPIYLGAAQDYRELSTRQIGLIGTVFFTGFTLTTAVGFYWIRRFDWRWTGLGAALVAAVGLVTAGTGESYWTLLSCVFVAGGALSMIYGIGTTALSDTSNPARWYGVKIASEAMMGALLLAILPGTVLLRWGFSGLAWALAGCIAILAPMLLWLPRQRVEGGQDSASSGSGSTNRPAVIAALVGCLLFMNGETVAWSFIERLGADAGFEPEAVGRLLAITLVVALSGSFLAAGLGSRFGTLKPLVVSHVAYFIAIAALMGNGFSTYAVGACLVMFSVGLGLPFAVTSVAELDRDGRFVVLTVPAIGVGMLIAPGAAGWLASSGSFTPVLAFGALNLALSLAAFLVAARLDRPQIDGSE